MFQKSDDGGLVYIGSKLVPHFDTYSHFREVKIISRTDTTTANVPPNHPTAQPKSHPWDPFVLVQEKQQQNSEENKENKNKTEVNQELEFLGFQGETATRSSVILRFKGAVDVMLTPLLLEGLQR